MTDEAHILYLKSLVRELQAELLKSRQETANLRAALERHPRREPTHIRELLAPLARRVDRRSTAV